MNGSPPCSSFILHRSSLFVPLSNNLGAQWIQSLLDALVAAIDLMNVVNHALAFSAQRCEQQRHAGANVGTRDLRAGETVSADDDRAVRIAQDDAGAHRDEFVGEEEARLERLID